MKSMKIVIFVLIAILALNNVVFAQKAQTKSKEEIKIEEETKIKAELEVKIRAELEAKMKAEEEQKAKKDQELKLKMQDEAQIQVATGENWFNSFYWVDPNAANSSFAQKLTLGATFTKKAQSIDGESQGEAQMTNQALYTRVEEGQQWGSEIFSWMLYNYKSEESPDSETKEWDFNWYNIGALKKYIGNSPYFAYGYTEHDIITKKDGEDENGYDMYIGAGTGYGKVVDLAAYNAAKEVEKAMIEQGIIAGQLPRSAIGELMDIVKVKGGNSNEKVVKINRMLADRNLIVKSSYSFDSMFLISEVVDQATSELQSGLEFKGFYKQWLVARKAMKDSKYGALILDIKYAKPLSKRVETIYGAYFEGMLYKGKNLKELDNFQMFGAYGEGNYSDSKMKATQRIGLVRPYLVDRMWFYSSSILSYQIINKLNAKFTYTFLASSAGGASDITTFLMRNDDKTYINEANESSAMSFDMTGDTERKICNLFKLEFTYDVF